MPPWDYIALDMLLLASLCMLGAGLAWKRAGRHILRAFGWVGFGTHWALQSPQYWAVGDPVNALGCLMAMPIFCYLGYHEALSHRWGDDYPPLRFVGWAMFAASFGFFVVERVPAVAGALIETVADQSVWLANLFGHNFGVGPVEYYGNPWYYKVDYLPGHEVNAPLIGVDIRIVLACTAIQAMLITAAFVFASRGKPCRKWQTFAVVSTLIYIINLGRNALVIVLTHENGAGYFEFAHNVVGKCVSLAALASLVLFAFWRIPELYEDINGAFDLFWRKGPNHDYKSNLGRVLGGRRGSAP
jgi:archaeosortase A (PGF-CTERM-specific)